MASLLFRADNPREDLAVNFHQIKKGVLACSIGGTNTHSQVYDLNGRLAADWVVPTAGYPSLLELIVDCGEQARKRLGANPDMAGLAFAGPVEPVTGRVTLTNVPQFKDEEATVVETTAALGMPTAHDNDVASAARRLGRLNELSLTQLTENPLWGSEGPTQHDRRLLIEIGTGVGTAVYLQNGDNPRHAQVLSSEIQHASSYPRGSTHETNLCGSRGFELLVREILESNLKLPVYVRTALEEGKDLGPIVTQTMTDEPEHPFTRAILGGYGALLGDYLRLAQLAYQPHAIFFGGSVGRAPNFLDRVVRERSFWGSFVDPSTVHAEERGRMSLMRIENEDLTVRGACDMVMHRLLG